MTEIPPRRLSLSDVAILIAAAAIGMVVDRYMIETGLLDTKLPSASADRTPRLTRAVTVGLGLAAPVLLAASWAVLAIELRRPRPTIETLARQPGFAALIVVALTTAYYLVMVGFRVVANLYSTPSIVATHVKWGLANAAIQTGWNVGVVWCVLAMQGNMRRRPDRSLGLAFSIGVGWVALRVVYDVYQVARMMILNYA